VTIIHAIVICFALAVPAAAVLVGRCDPSVMASLITLAGTVIGVAGGNAQANLRHAKKPKKKAAPSAGNAG
jgi:hypothetical protein